MFFKTITKTALLGTVFVLTSIASAISAPNIPCSTAKLIVPWGAGGGTDVIFRQFVDNVNKAGAKPQLQVVNINGQGGNKGAKQAANAKPDGCTLFAIHQSAITSYFTGRIDITWDAFEPISLLTSTTSIIGAAKDTPYSNLTELIAAAKKKPGEITAGGTFGSTSQFVFLLIEDAAGVKFKHVSYDGTKERMTALLAGNIDIGEINLAVAKKHMESKSLKALAVTAPAPLKGLPMVATAKSQGADVNYGVDRGVVAPKGTSKAILDHYAAMFKAAATDKAIIDTMAKKGTDVVSLGPDDYKKHFQSTFDKWLPIAKQVGVYKR